jgi:hypothetical protein
MPKGDRTGSEPLPGAALPRDIAAGEHVEKEIDQFISRRHEHRVASECERNEEVAWKASERRAEARRREENRLAWYAYFCRLAESLRSRAEEYDQRADVLSKAPYERNTA